MPEPEEIDFAEDWNIRRGVPDRVYMVGGNSVTSVYIAELHCHGEGPVGLPGRPPGRESWRVSLSRVVFRGRDAQLNWVEGGRHSVSKASVFLTPEEAIIEARGLIQNSIRECEQLIEQLRGEIEQRQIAIRTTEARIREAAYPTEADF